MDTITGCWKGALITEDGQLQTPFSLNQPSHTTGDARPTVSFEGMTANAQLLDGASRSLVALADAPDDIKTGRFAQLLLEARVLGDRLVGQWLRRDANGRIIASGRLMAARA